MKDATPDIAELLGDEDGELNLPSIDALDELDAASLGIDEQTQFILEKLAAVEEALLEQHPTLPTLLKQIHSHLLKHPEVTTVLAPEAVGVYIRGLKAYTQKEITVAKISKPRVSKKLLEDTSLDGLLA